MMPEPDPVYIMHGLSVYTVFRWSTFRFPGDSTASPLNHWMYLGRESVSLAY